MLSELADHAADCLERMLKSEEFGAAALLFVPSKSDVEAASNRFITVYEQMIINLKQKTVIKCDDDVWRLPKQAHQVNSTFRKLFSESPLENRKLWISTSFSENKYQDALNELGVQSYRKDDVLPFYKTEQWITAQSSDWYIKLYEYLFLKQKIIDSKEIDYLNIFPTNSGKLYCAIDKKVFIPINHARKGSHLEQHILS